MNTDDTIETLKKLLKKPCSVKSQLTYHDGTKGQTRTIELTPINDINQAVLYELENSIFYDYKLFENDEFEISIAKNPNGIYASIKTKFKYNGITVPDSYSEYHLLKKTEPKAQGIEFGHDQANFRKYLLTIEFS